MAENGYEKDSRKNGESDSEQDELNETLIDKDEDANEGAQAIRRLGRTAGRSINKSKKVEESQPLTLESIRLMKVTQLKEYLKKLHLDATGKKAELQERLSNYIEPIDNSDEEDDAENETEREDDIKEIDTDEDSDAKENEDRQTRHVMRDVGRNRGLAERRRHTPERRERHRSYRSFTIKDVENSVPYFTGKDKLPIKKWINDFEDIATLLHWDELKKFIYGKHMLSGAALRFITYERGITSWRILKRRLKDEFKMEVNDADVHAQLAKRKRQINESGREYIYSMQEIAGQGNVKEDALIQYIIDGVQDDEASKTILYSASTLTELKKRFDTYDRMKDRSDRKKFIRKENGRDAKETKSYTKKRNCYGCGSLEHDVKNCTNREKGPKCFKCNLFGHIAIKCPERNKVEASGGKVNCVSSTNKYIRVKVNNVECFALVDTGSEVTILRKDVYEKMGCPRLRKSMKLLTGFGKAVTTPIGALETNLTIDNSNFEAQILVVPTTTTEAQLIIGQDVLKEAEVTIRRGQVRVRQLTTDESSGEAAEGAKVEGQHIKMPEVQDKEECNSVEDSDSDKVKEISDIMSINESVLSEMVVSEPFKSEIRQLIEDYKPSKCVNTEIETKLILSDSEPVYSRPRRLAPKERQILDSQICEWLQEGVIQQSKSEYTSPVVIVPKKKRNL